MGSPYYQADFPGRLRRRADEASARRRAVFFSRQTRIARISSGVFLWLLIGAAAFMYMLSSRTKTIGLKGAANRAEVSAVENSLYLYASGGRSIEQSVSNTLRRKNTRSSHFLPTSIENWPLPQEMQDVRTEFPTAELPSRFCRAYKPKTRFSLSSKEKLSKRNAVFTFFLLLSPFQNLGAYRGE